MYREPDSLANCGGNRSAETSNILYTNFDTKVNLLEDISEEQKASYKKQVVDAIEKTTLKSFSISSKTSSSRTKNSPEITKIRLHIKRHTAIFAIEKYHQ